MNRVEVDVRDAAADLEQLLDRAAAGDDVVITRDGTPVARLVPLRRQLGFVRGEVPGTFDEPLPDAELDHWS
jgi:prevent-host-death family protein